RPCSRHSPVRCAWPSRPIRARKASCRRPRARSNHRKASNARQFPMPDIAVVDYGMGNLRSVAKALKHVAPERDIVVTGDPHVIRNAHCVVLPGQSAMPDCMASLDSSGLTGVVLEAARERPFLGICLGLQMLFEASEEGDTRCLALLRGNVVRFRDTAMVA